MYGEGGVGGWGSIHNNSKKRKRGMRSPNAQKHKKNEEKQRKYAGFFFSALCLYVRSLHVPLCFRATTQKEDLNSKYALFRCCFCAVRHPCT